MVKRMLVDATHPEETRVVVVSGNRVEEFDFETSTKKQLKGNIYLARVTRVEPSLQAAFVEYGGNRHGFLAFGEIHPDYYRIPVADRQALLAAEAAEDEDAPDRRPEGAGLPPLPPPPMVPGQVSAGASLADALDRGGGEPTTSEPSAIPAAAPNVASVSAPAEPWSDFTPSAEASPPPELFPAAQPLPSDVSAAPAAEPPEADLLPQDQFGTPATADAQPLIEPAPQGDGAPRVETVPAESVVVESVGGDELEEVERRRRHRRPMRHYKIQEVIKRRQILLVQVVKEERGTKGAALTTYLSLAGRYCVLMPNTARGGGISRRITNSQDRRRLKQIMDELQVPDGMAVILRTAGMERSNAEIKRDYEYLMRLWDDIRELTLHSVAPCLIYEEGNLVKRAIRDLYSSDIEEILVEGESGYESARSFMNMLMPDHVGHVRRYDDPAVPLFQRFQVEGELDDIHSPTVRLRSGGYIVINQTEALVAIDVNSGRATRERHIEETALRTNLEAADELARHLRLRDLAGLIVVDFIDMEDHRNQHAVERRLKDAMRSDRARIQIGRISPFGLLELSRQRLRPSLAEVSSEVCQHCGGTGRVRSTESTVLHVLRGIEEEGMRLRTVEANLFVPTAVALYMLNHKRDALQRIESRYGLRVMITADEALIPPAYRLDRTKMKEGAPPPQAPGARPAPPTPVRVDSPHPEAAYARPSEPAGAEEGGGAHPEHGGPHEFRREGEEGREGRGRRRRRRRRGRGGHGQPGDVQPQHGERPYEGPARQDFGAGAPGPGPMPEAESGPTPLIPERGNVPPQGGHGRPEPYYGEGHGQGQGQEQGQGQGEEYRGRRRRRRGRRGGRRHQGEGGPPPGAGAPGEPHTPQATQAPRMVMGPGHDLPPESPFAAPTPPEPPRQVEGPGHGHDWPWNRRAEAEPQIAERSPPRQPEPAPQAAPKPPRAAAPAEPPPQPEPEAPQGPPRKGWWKRLTS